jgi:hypothetical protein
MANKRDDDEAKTNRKIILIKAGKVVWLNK